MKKREFPLFQTLWALLGVCIFAGLFCAISATKPGPEERFAPGPSAETEPKDCEPREGSALTVGDGLDTDCGWPGMPPCVYIPPGCP